VEVQSRLGSLGRPGAAPGRTSELRRYAAICQDLALREFQGRYRGNLAGVASVFVVPLAFLLTYSFVFSTIIPIRLREDASKLDYTFFLFVGLVAWNQFADAVGRSPGIFAASSQFVRMPRFPASALAVVPCLSSYYQGLVWLGVFAVVRVLLGETVPVSFVWAPLVLAGLAVLAMGLSLLLATLGVFFRELGELLAPALTLAMFVSPVLYPADRVAAVSPELIRWNPVAPTIVMLRSVMLDGDAPDPRLVLQGLGWAVVFALVALPAYRRARAILGDLH
jgi:lipopolysaccharide transport system permease protein